LQGPLDVAKTEFRQRTDVQHVKVTASVLGWFLEQLPATLQIRRRSTVVARHHQPPALENENPPAQRHRQSRGWVGRLARLEVSLDRDTPTLEAQCENGSLVGRGGARDGAADQLQANAMPPLRNPPGGFRSKKLGIDVDVVAEE